MGIGLWLVGGLALGVSVILNRRVASRSKQGVYLMFPHSLVIEYFPVFISWMAGTILITIGLVSFLSRLIQPS